MIDFCCPGCGEALSVADHHAGKTGKCKHCGDKIRIPHTSPPVVPVPPPAALPSETLPAASTVSPPRTQRRRTSDTFFGGIVCGVLVAAGLAAWMRLDQQRQPSPRERFSQAESSSKSGDNGVGPAPNGGGNSASPLSPPVAGTTHGKESTEKTGQFDTPDPSSKDKPVTSSGESPPTEDDAASDDDADEPDFEPPVPDKDETEEGRAQLTRIEGDVNRLMRERDLRDRERRPFVLERDDLEGKVTALVAENQDAEARIQVLSFEIQQLDMKKNATNDATDRYNLSVQIAARQGEGSQLKGQIDARRGEISQKSTRITALNRQIFPLDKKINDLWKQLNEARDQWLSLHQVDVKYARGDYEALRSILNEWLLSDGLWPQAHSWAALCAFEMNDLDQAQKYAETARRLYHEHSGSKLPHPQLESLNVLVHIRTPGRASQNREMLSKLSRLAAKRKDWEAYYVIGRCFADRNFDLRKAKAMYDNALKHNSDYLCAQIGKARVQIIAKPGEGGDREAGLAVLEAAWKSTGKRSLRLALDLAEQYRANEDNDRAQRMFQKALTLAPDERRNILKEDWTRNTK